MKKDGLQPFNWNHFQFGPMLTRKLGKQCGEFVPSHFEGKSNRLVNSFAIL